MWVSYADGVVSENRIGKQFHGPKWHNISLENFDDAFLHTVSSRGGPWGARWNPLMSAYVREGV